MALARIITRSQACSRALALDLLSRGYAVEIVSPDAIPDNIADLELRVEEDPGNQLSATVEARNGERTASLEFLHYLKAPVPEFVRRPIETPQTVPVAEAAENIAKSSLAIIESPAEPAQLIASPLAALGSHSGSDADVALISSPEAPAVPEVPGYFPAAQPLVVAPHLETTAPANLHHHANARSLFSRWRWRSRSAGWFLRTAFTFASVVLIALFLALGARRIGRAPGQSDVTSSRSTTDANPGEVSVANSIDPAKIAASEVIEAPATGALSKNVNAASQPAAVATSMRAIETAQTVSPPRRDDVVARDTVTYLDKRFQPRVAAVSPKRRKADVHLVRHRTRHPLRDKVIAANKVTYLDKPTPKPAK